MLHSLVRHFEEVYMTLISKHLDGQPIVLKKMALSVL